MSNPFPSSSPFYSQFQLPPSNTASAARADEPERVIDNVGIEKHVLEEWVYALRGAAELAEDGRRTSHQGPAPADAIDRIADEISNYLDH